MWIAEFGAIPPGRRSNLMGDSSADANLGQGCGTDLEPQCLEAHRQAICSPRVWRVGALCQLHQGPAYRLAKHSCPAGCGSTTQSLGSTPAVSDGALSRGHLGKGAGALSSGGREAAGIAVTLTSHYALKAERQA